MAANDSSRDDKWDIAAMEDEQLLGWLTASGKRQQELFRQARLVRKQHFGNKIHLRGVIEVSNYCQKKCAYCAMFCKNLTLERYRLEPAMIMEIAKTIAATGITTVFLQTGQDPHCDPLLEEVIPAIRYDLGLDVLLNVGERDKEQYLRFAQLGARSYILKFESSDSQLYRQVAEASLSKRLECMQWVREAGMRLGTGNIIGLPAQSLASLIADIRLALQVEPDFVSTAPFVPNEGTPLEHNPYGDINLALNTIAIWRIGLKQALIPTVSALEKIQRGGQLLGLNAGANVMTINFTPEVFRNKYAIYSKERFVVSLDHMVNTAKAAGLEWKKEA
jgi:biotin synthase